MSNLLYKITKEEFEDLYNMAQEIHGNICVIKKFCEDYKDIDDFYKIMPLINYSVQKSDTMFSCLINKKIVY